MAYGVSSYRRTSIQTADPRQVIVLLYEGAIKNLRQARAFMEGGNFEAQGQKINKTLDILQFLDNALDYDQGGEIARHLGRLYAYMRDQLILANVEKSLPILDEVIALLGTVLEGWRGIAAEAASDTENANDTAESVFSGTYPSQAAPTAGIYATR